MKTSNLISIGLTGLLLFAYIFLSNNPELVSEEALNFLNIAVLIFGSIVIVNFLSSILVDFWFVRFQGKEASDLVKLVVALLLYGVCALLIFRLLGQDITAIFATSALITALIGFALQSPLGNLFSGVALQIDQPFQIGDRVIIHENEGQVVSMTWRATTIRTSDNTLVQIPNGLMSEEVVKMIPCDGTARRCVEFIVVAKFPPQKVIDSVSEAITNRPSSNINLDRPIQVRMWEHKQTFECHFITYRIFYYPRIYDSAENQTDREILRRAWYALQRQGMVSEETFAFTDQHLELIRSIELFKDLNLEAQTILLQQSKSLLFDIGETLNRHNLPEQAMFIVINGLINVQQKINSVDGYDEFQMFSRRPKKRPPVLLNRRLVDGVAFQLAQYIGPTAFSLAYEQQSSSLYWLYQHLAREIPNLDERVEFLGLCPLTPVEQLQSGDCFGEISLFFGESLAEVTMTSIAETELLVVPQQALAAVLERDRSYLEILTRGFAKYQADYLLKTMQMPGEKVWDVASIGLFLEEKFNLKSKESTGR